MRSSKSSRAAGALAAIICTLALTGSLSAQIALGDLVVLRIGNGVAPLSNGSQAVFLDEYTTAGASVQSIPMPIAASGSNRALTNSGSATSEGNLNQSVDGRYLILAGYDAAPGVASVASTGTTGAGAVARVIGRVEVSNALIDTSTALISYSGNNVRSATSLAGNDFYVGGPSNGISYVASVGATSSTQLVPTGLTNIRVIGIFAGQLYVSSASGGFQGVSTIGSGIPTTAPQTATILPGFPTTSGPSSYDFWFADQTTVYVADDRATIAGGIQKWVYSLGVWSLAYTLQPSVSANLGCRGVTGVVSGGVTTLYATTAEATADRIVTVTDTGAGSAFTTLATAPTNTIFRGIRLIKPGPAATPYGAGCAGTGGLTPVLSSTQLPFIGNLGFSVDLSQAAAGAPAYLYGSIGTDPIGTPLAGSCTAYLNVTSALDLIAGGIFPVGGLVDGAGFANIPLPIPYAPFLSGIHAGLQVLVFDGGSPVGFTLSNAVDMHIE